jgi:hypothetical protein
MRWPCFTCDHDHDMDTPQQTTDCERCGAPLCEKHKEDCAFCRGLSDEELYNADPIDLAIRVGWIKEDE